jgi:hypothetical protein
MSVVSPKGLDNYLVAEELIIRRLKFELGPDIYVFSAADLATVKESMQFLPAVHVFYGGDIVSNVGEPTPGRSWRRDSQIADQQWYVAVVTKSARDNRQVTAGRVEAGVICMKVIGALQGFSLSSAHEPLKRVNGQSPFFKAGFAVIPLLFTTRMTITTTNQSSPINPT